MRAIPTLYDLLHQMAEAGASDLLITAGMPPIFRIDGELEPQHDLPPLDREESKAIIYSILKKEQIHRFERDLELDLSFSEPDVGRFRMNVYQQRGAISAAIRILPFRIPSLQELGVPQAITGIIKKPKGLILITGPTGNGKSTTLASIIDLLNREVKKHIITVEDPIEYVHKSNRCVIEQREVRYDTHSFSNALKHIFRQDPDVILIGEMRDRETMETALTMAETGHLTFATLHTNSAAESLNRIIDAFPGDQQNQVRSLLSIVLEGVLSQKLLPKVGGGRILATELMIPSDAMRHLIRRGDIMQIYSQMMLERGRGNHTMNDSLYELYQKGEISMEVAIASSFRPDELMRRMEN